MRRILVTGALGQIGSELVPVLRAALRRPSASWRPTSACRPAGAGEDGPFEFLDVTNIHVLQELVRKHEVETIYHLAALLSAVSEQKPHVAWDLNMGGLYRVLEVARQNRCAVFFPSSIGAFGPSTPRDRTPQDTIQRPTTMYGVTKVAGELLCDYYHRRFGVDTRGLRFPGLISYVSAAGRRHHRLRGRDLLRGDPAPALHLLPAARHAPRHDVHARRAARHRRAHGGGRGAAACTATPSTSRR